MKIAIIGTGISGLGAAYLLHPHHDITVYEKNARIGGHSRTITFPIGSGITNVDTGFIVFNDWNYPHLMALFQQLKVPYQKSNMSFGASIDDGWLEYSSNGLIAQKKNLLRPAYWMMMADIIRFNRQAPCYIEKNNMITLEECLDELKMGAWFRQYYLLAMGAAIWSCPLETIMKFPASTFLQFFKNHGLLNLRRRPQWYTVTGGSKEYIKRLTQGFEEKILKNCAAQNVYGHQEKIAVEDSTGKIQIYDRVVFACHADEALAIIKEPCAETKKILGSFEYQENRIVVHGDESFMPKNKQCWASWIYLSETKKDTKPVVSLSYWMNNLQDIDRRYPIFVTLNPGRMPDQRKIYDEYTFAHPIFDQKAIMAQSAIQKIQGRNNFWFCGAYQRYGFHEDGLLSAVQVAKHMGVRIPWE